MTITYKTELSEILVNTDVTEAVTTMNQNLQNLIEERLGVLKTEMTSGKGLGEEQVVDDNPIFYLAADEIYQQYDVTASNIRAFSASMCRAAVERERDELEELKRKKQDFITHEEDWVRTYTQEYNRYLNIVNNGDSIFNNESLTAEQMRSKLKEVYYGTDGKITIKNNYINQYNAKMAEVDARLAKLPAEYSKYGDSKLNISDKKDDYSTKMNDGQYAIDVTIDDDDSADRMYDDAVKLEKVLAKEERDLTNYYNEIKTNNNQLKYDLKNGKITQADYDAKKAENEAKISLVGEELEKRKNYHNQIHTLIEDKDGANDGTLKDLSDGWTNKSDSREAQKLLEEPNKYSFTLRNMNDVIPGYYQ